MHAIRTLPIDAAYDHMLEACFLGPHGENAPWVETLLTEFFDAHVRWRRNFHPEDPSAIGIASREHADYRDFEASLHEQLRRLSQALERSVPFHSPRYIGHMVSDLLLPGLLAYMLALPYNPNNVSDEAAPVTVDMEIEVGLQLARMLGYPHDPIRNPCAFGHLTEGGTIANYQALRLALALKAFPVALRAAKVPDLALPPDDWAAFNLAHDDGIALLESWRGWLAAQNTTQCRRWRECVERERIEHLGIGAFFAAHPQLAVPRVLVPGTAHYSWSKGLKLLGLGRAQLELIATDGMRMDPEALDAVLRRCTRRHEPVLLCVGVLGTTEYGTIDPIDEIVAARGRTAAQGLAFDVHVDAAWGGYLATLFRNEDGSMRTRQDVAAGYAHFPEPTVHAAFAALGRTDSATVDPHKLGHLPYGCGAFVCRDHRAMMLLAERADYVFHGATDAGYRDRYRNLGQFIVAGSKPGAAAAAVYVTHQVLPLDHMHFGRIPAASIRAAEAFRVRAQRFMREVADIVRAAIPFPVDTNLVCLALNLKGNTEVVTANAFMSRVYATLRCDPGKPPQARQFYGSLTSFRPELAGTRQTWQICGVLGLDAGSFDATNDHLLILRHTLMNPFLIDRENDLSYADLYFNYLTQRVRELATPVAGEEAGQSTDRERRENRFLPAHGEP